MIPLINRELSLLAFNERVMTQSELAWVPALERLRYLTIVSSNLDEFFEVRIAELKEQLDGLAPHSPEAVTLRDSLQQVARHAHALIDKQYRLLNTKVLPQLRESGIELLRDGALTAAQKRWALTTFRREIAPVLTPIGLDPAHPFPAVANKGLHYIVEMRSRRNAAKSSVAIVKVPRSLPRLLEISEASKSRRRVFVLLSTIIELGLAELFPGREVLNISAFRVTRDSDLWVDEQEMTNLRLALAGELRRRPFGRAVRLEVDDACPASVVDFLCAQFDLQAQDVYRVDGPVNLARLQALVESVDMPALRFPPHTPAPASIAASDDEVFDRMRRGDILLHHPYQSFEPVVQFLRSAVADPSVIAIKQTIYRTGSKSILMELLLEAVRRGKEVTVVLELKARFDEETNINWAEKLEHAGAQVVYGLVGLKTHAKMALVLRKEGNTIQHYAHIGTGNYNPGTARFYTDFGLLTARQDVAREVAAIFHHLTSLSRPPLLRHLWWAPHTMKQNILAAIQAEQKAAAAGKPARIMAKVNSLTDETVIAALYEAGRAGVKIDLVVRGACRLAPQLPEWSENIQVRSIVGRFLEHSRVYYFENGGDPQVYISSADWMSRNLDRRVEVAAPILDLALKTRVIEEGLLDAFRDNSQAWQLEASGAYRLLRPGRGHKAQAMQLKLAQQWRDGGAPQAAASVPAPETEPAEATEADDEAAIAA